MLVLVLEMDLLISLEITNRCAADFMCPQHYCVDSSIFILTEFRFFVLNSFTVHVFFGIQKCEEP